MKGNALILLSNGKTQSNTSRNPDEKAKLFIIGWVLAILCRKRDDFTDEFETSSTDGGMGKTVRPYTRLDNPWTYLSLTVRAFNAEK